MIKKLGEVLLQKKFTSKEDQVVIDTFTALYPPFSLQNFEIDKRILRFKKIPSALRMKILMNKKKYLIEMKKRSISLRDIL